MDAASAFVAGAVAAITAIALIAGVILGALALEDWITRRRRW